MSEQRILAEFADYDGWIDALRRRKNELELSFETMDALSGLPQGYCAKILGPARVKSLGPISTELINGVLAVKFIMVEDVAAMTKIQSRWEKRCSAHVR